MNQDDVLKEFGEQVESYLNEYNPTYAIEQGVHGWFDDNMLAPHVVIDNGSGTYIVVPVLRWERKAKTNYFYPVVMFSNVVQLLTDKDEFVLNANKKEAKSYAYVMNIKT